MKTTKDYTKEDPHLFCIHHVSKVKHKELISAQVIKNDFLALRCLARKITKGGPTGSCYQRSLNLGLPIICLRYLYAHLTKWDCLIVEVMRAKGQGKRSLAEDFQIAD